MYEAVMSDLSEHQEIGRKQDKRPTFWGASRTSGGVTTEGCTNPLSTLIPASTVPA